MIVHRATINGWHVVVARYGDTVPVVCAARYLPAFDERSILMPDASPSRVRAWVEALPVTVAASTAVAASDAVAA